MKLAAIAALCASLALGGCESAGDAGKRDHISVVGSSTIYPFTVAVAEAFKQSHANFKAPVIESTGTGGGVTLFCAGTGAAHPDILDASRRLKPSEAAACKANGVSSIVEVQIGLDGIAFAESSKGLKLPLTVQDVYNALAANPGGLPQTAKTWHDVNPKLPAEPIKVYGPPKTSGTRDALVELIMLRGCDAIAAMRDLAESAPDQHQKQCSAIRTDGAYVEAGENDAVIVQKLEADPKSIGVFGYSFVEANPGKLVANTLNGVLPTYATISDFSYPGSRPLYIYLKKAHVGVVPGLKEFVADYVRAAADNGLLKGRGLVVAPPKVREEAAKAAADLIALDPSTLK